MNRTRLIIMVVLFTNLLLITTTMVTAQPIRFVNYGSAVPDGSEGEWNTTPGPGNPDWVAFTCPGGSGCSSSNATGNLFMRFDANAPNQPNPNMGDMFFLWVSNGTYTADTNPNCDANKTCRNWMMMGGTIWTDDSNPYLANLWPPIPGAEGDVWRQLTNLKGFETTSIEWDCNLTVTIDVQGVANGTNSSTGPIDITPRCIGIDSSHGPTGPAGSTTYDTLTISSTLTSRPTGTVTWYYCHDSATTIPPSSTFPNGCLPNDPLLRFVSTPIGSTPITKLYTPPPPMRVAWNTSRAGAIPILLGPLLAPQGAFNPNITVTTQSPNFTPTQVGTYCYYATYAPSTTAQGAGYTAMAHTNNSTECFIMSLPTAVSISSMTAQVGWPSANLPLLFGVLAGAVAIIGAGVVGIGKLLRMF